MLKYGKYQAPRLSWRVIHKNMPKLKIIDGFKFRNHNDVNFAMIGDHISYPYIPQNEIWLEKIYLPEKIFVLDSLKEKRRLMKKYSYEKVRLKMRPDKIAGKSANVKIKLLKKQGATKVYLVNGAMVRKNLDPFFALGGHWRVYKYVPKNEVWIDNALLTKEIKYVLIHELFELKLMGRGKVYDTAHDWANAAEKEARRDDGAVYFDEG